jgi:hypothetical protein
MYRVEADPARRRMEIVCDQALTRDDFHQLIARVELEAGRLDPGWVAAVDFRGMWVTDPFINEEFQRLQDVLLAARAGKIGTLLDSDPLKMRLWQSGTQTRSNEVTRRFHDPAQWEQFLSTAEG